MYRIHPSGGVEMFAATGVIVHAGLVLTVTHAADARVIRMHSHRRTVAKRLYCGCLALLVLDQPLPLGFVPPKLATAREFDLAKSRSGTIAGFGRTSWDDAGSAGSKRAGRGMSIAAWPPTEPEDEARSHFAVTGPYSICPGDSGGPYFCRIGGRRVVVGIASRCPEGSSGIFVRVDAFRNRLVSAARRQGISLDAIGDSP